MVGGRTAFTSKNSSFTSNLYRSKRIQINAFIITDANFAVGKFELSKHRRGNPIAKLCYKTDVMPHSENNYTGCNK